MARPTTTTTNPALGSLLALLLGLVLVMAVLWSLQVSATGNHAREGWTSLRSGHYTGAVRSFENALNAALDVPGPGYNPTLTRLGLSYSYLAKRDYARAAAVLPKSGDVDPWSDLQRGLVAAAAGDEQGARAIWTDLAAQQDLPPAVTRSALWHLAQSEWPHVGTALTTLAAIPAAHDPYVISANLLLAQFYAPTHGTIARDYIARARSMLPLDNLLLASPNLRLDPALDDGLTETVINSRLAQIERDMADAADLRSRSVSAATIDAAWGRSYIQQEEWELARQYLERSVVAQLDLADARAYLGLAKQRLGDIEGAEHELRVAIQIDPQRGLAHHLLARMLIEEGRNDEAFPHLEAALHAGFNNIVVHLDIAAWYEQRGSYLLAESEYTQAEALQNTFNTAPQINTSLNLANFYLGRFFATGGCELSREAARRAVARNPGSGEYDALGWSQHLCGNPEPALEALHQAVRLDPTSPRAHYHLGVLLKSTGQRQTARRELELAQDFDPNGIWAERALTALVQP